MLMLNKHKRTPEQDEAFNQVTEAVTPNVYLGHSPLNPDLIEGLQQDVDKGPTVIEKIALAKLSHIQDRRWFVSVPRPITDDVWELSQPRNHWWFHLTDVPGWEKWYEVDFNRPYHMTDQQLEGLGESKQRSLLIDWKPGTEIPIVIVSWKHEPNEPNVPSGWYFLEIEDEYSGELNAESFLHDSVKAHEKNSHHC